MVAFLHEKNAGNKRYNKLLKVPFKKNETFEAENKYMESVFNYANKRSLKLFLHPNRALQNASLSDTARGIFFHFRSFWSWSFIFFVLFCNNSLVYAQMEPQFSQNMFNPIVVNPGFAGNSGRINVVAMDRHQWIGMQGAPRTTVVGADMAIKNVFGNPGGVGLTIMNDEIGFFRNIFIQASLSQRYFVADGTLGIGFSLGILNQVFDGTKAVTAPGGGGSYHNATDNLVPGTEESGTAFDTGLGAWFSRSDFYAGISILHLFEPKPNFNDQLNVYIPRSFFITGGYNYAFIEAPVMFKPSFFLKNSGNSWQLDVNALFEFQGRYWGGISYRIQDAVVFLGGVELRNGVRIGYSYDLTTSQLRKAGDGSHEIMVGYTFDLSFEKREKRYRSIRFL